MEIVVEEYGLKIVKWCWMAVVEAVEAMDKGFDTMWESFEAQREREREREERTRWKWKNGESYIEKL